MDGTGESGQHRTEPLPGDAVSSGGEESSFSTLSAEEFESWTLLDSSPKRSKVPLRMDSESAKNSEPEKAPHSDDEVIEEEAEDPTEDDEVVDEEEDESESDGADDVDNSEPVESKNKPSGVERVQEKSKITKRETNARDGSSAERKIHKKTENSRKRLDSHDGFSSDGISVISESEGSSEALLASRAQPSLHFRINDFDACTPPTPPLSPESDKTQRQNQLKRKRSRNDGDQGLVQQGTLMPWSETHRSSIVALGVIFTAVVAILVGNSRMYHNRITEYNFQHEQRISELELENNILKNEMNKLKHLYTRSELDEQVQQAEFQWKQAMENEVDEVLAEPEPEPEPEAEPQSPEKSEEPVIRKVPPQDDNIKRHVVWSGDDESPMLVADEDYVLPEFCYNKHAVQDALFSEYTAKYCDIKQRKVESKLRKVEHAKKHKKFKEPKDYTRYIYPTEEEVAEHTRQATAAPPKVPSLSPFEFDFHKAYQTIKEEGAAYVDSLSAALNLDPEPELLTPVKESSSECSKNSYDGYSADDEASTTADESSAGSSDSIQSEKVETVAEMQWDKYPPWVKEKYEHRPEMYERVKKVLERHSRENVNDFRRNSNEKPDRSKGKNHASHEEYRKESDQSRNGGKDGKEYNENRYHQQSMHHRNQKHPQDGDSWKQNNENRKHWKHQHRQQEPHRQENKDHQNRVSNNSPSTGDGSYADPYRNEYKRQETLFQESSDEQDSKQFKKSSQQGSGDRERKSKEWSDDDYKKPRNGKHWDSKTDQTSLEKNSNEWKKQNTNFVPKERREQKKDEGNNKGWNNSPKKDNNSENNKHHNRDEQSSGEGSYVKHYDNDYKNEHKQKEQHYKKYDERKPNYNRRRDDDDDDDDEDDHYKHHQGDKRRDHRDDDSYRKSQKDWHEKHHKGKHNHWEKHRDEKRHDRDEHAFQEKGR